MEAPTATYRIQLNADFTFDDLKAILPYLKELGISHIYASPIFQAKKGSLHGYDVVDPNRVSEELGGQECFEDVRRESAALGLGWLQDIVPNHASYSSENQRISDVQSKGAGSAYACFFDVDWNHPGSKLFGKVMAPFLSETYQKSLKTGQIRLVHTSDFKLQVGGHLFPLSAGTQQHLEMDGEADSVLQKYNSRPDFLDAIVAKQHYSPAQWQTALRHINYRRFFDIIDLIGIRMENPAAFEQMQQLILELAESGSFSALRVDHIDGLYDPAAYLEQLRSRLPKTYLVVEKILSAEEQLPRHWPVEGTTGYDFCDCVNKLLVQPAAEAGFNRIYETFTDSAETYEELLYSAKKSVIETYFLGDMRNLSRLFDSVLRKLGYEGSWNRRNLLGALVEIMACFPIYRTYIDDKHRDAAAFMEALGTAQKRNPSVDEAYSAVGFILKASQSSPDALDAVMRFQQYSGAVMAKGFEDTALYRYNRLLCLNEVGSNPSKFGITTEQFHHFNQLRQQTWPLTLNSTSTHDSKRGEDVRARLSALSEIPNEFQAAIQNWRKINASKKQAIRGVFAPDAGMEYFLYQTILGAYPWSRAERMEFAERIERYVVKALREQKVHTSWLSPKLHYEAAVADFAKQILDSRDFLDEFLPLQQKIAALGALNSLSQTLLKIACPGIPDFYLGTELWNLKLVDPDNRRSVNFPLRKQLLSEITQLKPSQVSELLADLSDAKAKLYLIHRALLFRGMKKQLFEKGKYIPIDAKGEYAEHVVAFCRQASDTCVVVVVPRFPAGLLYIRGGGSAESNGTQPTWNKAGVEWADTYIELTQTPLKTLTDIFSYKNHPLPNGRLLLSDILADFPVAMLWGNSNG